MSHRRLLLLISAACVVPAVLDALQVYMQAVIAGGDPPSWRSVVWQGAEWLIFGALTPLAYFSGRRFPLRRPHVARNLLPHAAAALTLCVGWATAGISLRWLLGITWSDDPRHLQLASWLLTSLPWSVFMYFAVLGTVHAIFYFVEAREREAQAARLAARVAEARLDALRMQLHPHFLFNSLNAITVLVRDRDTASATRMLEMLGDVLRQVLRADRTHEIRLDEELRFTESYLAIEQVRFSDRLAVSFDVGGGLRDAVVPAFVLQPLVENALRHGVVRRSDHGRLEISARREGDDLVLAVADDGPGPGAAAEAPPREGVGLANTRERLATLYGPRARLELSPGPRGGTVAVIRLPWRRLDAERPAPAAPSADEPRRSGEGDDDA
ncbi:MAG TPA: histidine kinase [Longimicrobium sp.]|nr:histidine kinase [Longimicrobium sp.]